jgi:riboflavin transporter FmnP
MSSKVETASISRSAPRVSTRYCVVTAMLSAVAFVLMYLEFSVPMLIPSFVKMDLSDLPALLGSFAMGPVCGVIVSLLKNVLHILIKGTSSNCIGELCNFALGAALSLTAGYIYKFHKNFKGAIVASVVGAVVMGLFSFPLNYFITYPFYASLFGGMDAIVAAYQVILPSMDNIAQCLIVFNIPFTIVKGLLCALVCFFIYKPLSPVLHGRKG